MTKRMIAYVAAGVLGGGALVGVPSWALASQQASENDQEPGTGMMMSDSMSLDQMKTMMSEMMDDAQMRKQMRAMMSKTMDESSGKGNGKSDMGGQSTSGR